MRISDWSSDVCSSDLVWVGSTSGRFAMLIKSKRGWELPDSAATPESLFHERRRLIKGLAAGPLIAAMPAALLGSPLGGGMAKDRKSVVEGTSVSVRVVLGGRRTITTKNKTKQK